MAGIIMVMLGLLFTTVNVPLITIKAYPEYHMIYNDSQMGEVIQKYVAHNMIGDKCTADIFSDVLGYIFILIGISLLIKYNIKFIRIYIPVIATDCPCGGPRDLIEDGVNGILTPVGDVDKMKENLQHILNDLQNALHMGQTARKSTAIYREKIVYREWMEYLLKISGQKK